MSFVPIAKAMDRNKSHVRREIPDVTQEEIVFNVNATLNSRALIADPFFLANGRH